MTNHKHKTAMNNNTKLLIVLILFFTTSIQAQPQTIWHDLTNNTQLVLTPNGQFSFASPMGALQGTYSIQNNLLMMQDTLGNYYQYSVQTYTDNVLVLMDQYGIVYSYTNNSNQTANTTSVNSHSNNYPWNNPAFSNVLSQNSGLQLQERDLQIYVELLQLLIGLKVSESDVDAMRVDFVNEFNANPQNSYQEVRQVETAMTQVYSLNNIEAVAMVREQLTADFHKLIQQKPEMNNYHFVKTLNRYVQILNIDYNTNLSLSNQDVDAYINYLQFQAMLTGQDYQLSQQDRMTLQVKLISEFNSYPAEQKQTLAFASFIWNIVATQWASLNSAQQQQYVAQIQSQMYGQNYSNVNSQTTQNYWNQVSQYHSNNSGYDIASVESRYRQEAAAKGMSLSQYLDYKQRDMAVNNQIFTSIQNSMTENHATMLNVINNMGGSDDYYYVDYSGY